MVNLKNWAERLFLWPLFGGITTVAGVLAGYLGSHFDSEIGVAVYPWFWRPGYVFSPGAFSFWVAAWTFGACFTGTFWAQARSTRRAEEGLRSATVLVEHKTDSLSAKTDVLDGLVRQLYTLPPKGFLATYREAVLLAHEAFFNAQGQGATADELATAIRAQLTCVLQIASAFDIDGNKAKYGCNIMAYLDSPSMTSEVAKRIDGRMKFVDTGVTVTKLVGALDLLLPLSVSSSSLVGPDSTLAAFALPIPIKPGSEHTTSIVLPGAPTAYVYGTEAAIESPEDWLERCGTFSATVQRELNEFFQSRTGVIESFVSVPLYRTAKNGGSPIGILNIHRHMPNKLLAEKLELFAPLLAPITSLMGRLLWTYLQLPPILPVAKESQV